MYLLTPQPDTTFIPNLISSFNIYSFSSNTTLHTCWEATRKLIPGCSTALNVVLQYGAEQQQKELLRCPNYQPSGRKRLQQPVCREEIGCSSAVSSACQWELQQHSSTASHCWWKQQLRSEPRWWCFHPVLNKWLQKRRLGSTVKRRYVLVYEMRNDTII